MRGVVKSVDAAKKQITITEGRVGEKTYTVDDNAIVRGQLPAKMVPASPT